MSADGACHADTMRLLLDHPSADAAAMLVHANGFGSAALTFAAGNGNVDATRLLLDHPFANPAAMVIHVTSTGETALSYAAGHGNVDAMCACCSTTRLSTQQL
jgi:ankyrin repeat protein